MLNDSGDGTNDYIDEEEDESEEVCDLNVHGGNFPQRIHRRTQLQAANLNGRVRKAEETGEHRAFISIPSPFFMS